MSITPTQKHRMKTPSFTRFAIASLAALGFLNAPTAHAAATPDPGDYTALPTGTNLAILYAQHLSAKEVYSKGSKVALPQSLDLTLDLGLFRYVQYIKLGEYRMNPQVIIPFGRQKVGLTNAKSSGIGDVFFGGSVWGIADDAAGEYLAYNVFITMPTGDDKSKGFALSDNRWAADFQVGYIRRITPQWTIDAIGEAEVYQDRRDTGSSKAPLVRGIFHLRRHLSDSTHVAASLRYATGARETLGASTLADRKSDTNLTLTVASFVTKQVQLQAQYSDDLKVESGPKLKTFALRALYAF